MRFAFPRHGDTFTLPRALPLVPRFKPLQTIVDEQRR
jgi:hypothetical protein